VPAGGFGGEALTVTLLASLCDGVTSCAGRSLHDLLTMLVEICIERYPPARLKGTPVELLICFKT
jgi:hypothetical protein